LMHILGHAITIHMPSDWMVYGDKSHGLQEGNNRLPKPDRVSRGRS
jgi:hypothetical protein